MEHEMRLAVLPRGVPGPMIMPYCIGCGWVGIRYALDSFRSVPAAWRTHVKEFDVSWWSIPDRDFLLSVLDEGGRLVVETPCEHGELEPHGWVCGEHDTDEKCPRQNCEAYLDFGDHCARLHRNDDACWSASACGGGSRKAVTPTDEA